MTTALPTLKICRACGCNVATSWDGYCPDHSGDRPLKDYSARPMPRNNTRSPIGVELELVHPNGARKITPIERYVCYDGSLPHNGGEIKILSPSSRVADKVADTVQRARIAGCEVSHRAGFHVHLSHPNGWNRDRYNRGVLYDEGHENRHEGAMDAVATWGGIVQDYLFSLMPPSRRDNTYCKRIIEREDISSHYSWLSWSSRIPTVEVRIHPSTVNPLKAKAWIETCLVMRVRLERVMNTQTRGEELETARSVFQGGVSGVSPSQYLALTPLSRGYLQAREKTPSLTKFGF